jgi:hypothetical protein
MVDGRWSMVDGRWSMVDGRWSMVDQSESLSQGPAFQTEGIYQFLLQFLFDHRTSNIDHRFPLNLPIPDYLRILFINN